MQAWVGITDRDCYRFLAGRPDLDEVNFWQSGGDIWMPPTQPTG